MYFKKWNQGAVCYSESTRFPVRSKHCIIALGGESGKDVWYTVAETRPDRLKALLKNKGTVEIA